VANKELKRGLEARHIQMIALLKKTNVFLGKTKNIAILIE